MRKVNNKKVIRRIADKTRKAGKKKNLIAVLAIAMTTVLFTSVFTVGGSLLEKQQQATMRQVGGSAHAGYKYLTEEEYELLAQDEKLKEVSYRILVGDAVNDELKKLTTEVSYYEDLDARWSFCYPAEGHMPEAEDEIVTSDLVLEALGVPCRLGESVPLVLDVAGKKIEKTFTLCGWFYGDTVAMSQVAAVSKTYANEVAPTPTNSVLESGTDASDYAGRIMADFNFSNSLGLEQKTEQLNERLGFPETAPIGVNWAYLGGSLDLQTVLLVVVLLAVILVSGYLIIYNIFYINVFADIRHYGMLKTIGATGRQLRKIVRRQANALSLYGIPVGLVLGALVGGGLLPVIMSHLVFSETTDTKTELNLWIFAGAALFSFVTVYLSCIKPCRIASGVTPIEAVRFTEGQKQRPHRGTKSVCRGRKKAERTPKVNSLRMALGNIRRSPKKVAVVVASLSLALVLLNSIYSLTGGFDMDKFASSRVVSDFSVQDATLDNTAVDSFARVTDGVTEEFLAELSEQEGIEESGNIYIYNHDPQFTEADFAKLKERILENDTVKNELASYGVDDEELQMYEDMSWMDGKVYGIGKLVMEKLENPQGELDWEKFATGNYVIATRFTFDEGGNTYFFQPGETVTLFNEAGEAREYEVLAVADMPYACELQVYGLFNCDYILPEQEFLDFMGETQPMRTLFNADEEHEAQIEEWLTSYCGEVNQDLDFASKSKVVEEFQSVKNMYAAVGGLLAFILAAIGILNFINTMMTSILTRRQELAMLEAVGMSRGQQRRMLQYEGLAYAALTGAVSLLLGGLLNATVIRSMGSQIFFFTWRFTVLPVALCLPVLALVVLFVPVLCYRSMCRESVVERMRWAE